MLITANTSKTPMVAVIETGNASGRTFANCEMGTPGATQIQTGWRYQ
jgi:hypothetical protein